MQKTPREAAGTEIAAVVAAAAGDGAAATTIMVSEDAATRQNFFIGISFNGSDELTNLTLASERLVPLLTIGQSR